VTPLLIAGLTDHAVAIMNGMATFAEAGVSDRDAPVEG